MEENESVPVADVGIDVELPKEYNVILLNDDVTTFEFVCMVLETVFHHNPAEAQRITMSVHHNGRGIAGVYTYDIANARATLTANMARKAGFPLRCIVEEK